MKPSSFSYVRPETLTDALSLLAEHADDASIIAGGQSLVPLMNFRLAAPGTLIDLNRVEELAGIREDGGSLIIGAMTRQSALLTNELVAAHAPLLRRAAEDIGHVQTRSRGTVGGSLAHADPAAELPLVMVALDATIMLRSIRGQRDVPARAFFRDALDTVREPDEILTEVRVPVTPQGARIAFREFARRHGDFAIVAVAAQSVPAGMTVAVGGLEAVPRHCAILLDELQRAGGGKDAIAAAIDAEFASLEPLGDLQASADYRRTLATVALQDCMEEVLPR